MKKRIAWFASCLMVAALVLSSCAPAVTEEEEVAPPVEEEEEVVEEEVAPAVGEPQYGGTLRILTVYGFLDPLSWNPADIAWMHNHSASPYGEMLIQGDLQWGPRGTNDFNFMAQAWLPMEFGTRGLAESWEVLSDQNILRFHLQQGVMWQDKPGVMAAREFVADDVVYSWNKKMDSPNRIPLYYDWIDSWEAVDKYTVDVHYNEYCGNWGYRLGWGYYCIVHPHEMDEAPGGAANWRNACGTGPFMLVDYVSSSSQTYKKNPNYWDKTIINGKEYKFPFVDTLIWPIIKDESTRLAAIRTGKVDIQESSSWKFAESLAETNPELTTWKWMATSPYMAAMRMDTAPFDDIRVRRAMHMAVDLQSILDTQHGGQGVILSFPFAIDWPLFTPIEELPESARELLEYNPEKAKQLLAEAGYPDGFSTKMQISVTGGTLMADMASVCVANWADIGVDVELEPLEYANYVSVMTSKTHAPMYMLSTGNGNPFSVLRKTYLPAQTWNPSMFDDAHLTDGWTAAMAETDIDKQNEILTELNVYIIDQCPDVKMPVPYIYRYAWPWVKNYYGEHCAGSVYPGSIHATIWIDQALKKEMGY